VTFQERWTSVDLQRRAFEVALTRMACEILLTHALITVGRGAGVVAPTALEKLRTSAPAKRTAAGLRNRPTECEIETM
jgi:hypothetical protein